MGYNTVVEIVGFEFVDNVCCVVVVVVVVVVVSSFFSPPRSSLSLSLKIKSSEKKVRVLSYDEERRGGDSQRA